MGIFKEETAGCIFILKDKECRKKADEINRVGEKGMKYMHMSNEKLVWIGFTKI